MASLYVPDSEDNNSDIETNESLETIRKQPSPPPPEKRARRFHIPPGLMSSSSAPSTQGRDHSDPYHRIIIGGGRPGERYQFEDIPSGQDQEDLGSDEDFDGRETDTPSNPFSPPTRKRKRRAGTTEHAPPASPRLGGEGVPASPRSGREGGSPDEATPPPYYRTTANMALYRRHRGPDLQPQGRAASRGGVWSQEEADALLFYMTLYPCHWSQILQYDKGIKGRNALGKRTGSDLRYKATNLATEMIMYVSPLLFRSIN